MWKDFEIFDGVYEKYLPDRGEGETIATQATTAVCKIVYKWFNDGDVYDNTAYMSGWCNDISSYANWLYEVMGIRDILIGIFDCKTDEDYEELLMRLCERVFKEDVLEVLDGFERFGSVYECDGPFRFVERVEDEDEY